MAAVNNDYKPKLLTFAAYEDPILRNKTNPIEFPLSIEDQQIIADMIYTIQPKQLRRTNAPWDAAVGMAANQWGINKSIFLYCPTGDTVNGLEVIINPSYEAINGLAIFASSEATKVDDWEGCFSVPLATGNIRRDFKIHVKYQDQSGTTIQKELSGFPARVWQHETDHLNGYLYDDPRHGKCIEKKVFANKAEVEEFYGKIREARK
jgi:peptide deformylase